MSAIARQVLGPTQSKRGAAKTPNSKIQAALRRSAVFYYHDAEEAAVGGWLDGFSRGRAGGSDVARNVGPISIFQRGFALQPVADTGKGVPLNTQGGAVGFDGRADEG